MRNRFAPRTITPLGCDERSAGPVSPPDDVHTECGGPEGGVVRYSIRGSGMLFELVDVRMDEEREFAKIDGSRLLDQLYHDALRGLDPNTPIVFQCHYGVRSRQAAEHFRHLGFRNLYNLRGGIDPWSPFVDPSVLRY
ncbi:MAG: rhodanese-like domain-containing protein [Acidobacteriota bacterium]|nr:rhodanese-like domain-containing protein [Acidobacteriota bacterium]